MKPCNAFKITYSLDKVGENIIKFLEEHDILVIVKLIFQDGTSSFVIQKIQVI